MKVIVLGMPRTGTQSLVDALSQLGISPGYHMREAVADYPAAIFPEELIEAYPEAAIILTVRDENKFYDSMMSTLIPAHLNAPKPNPSPMAPLAVKYHTHCWNEDFPTYGRDAYRRQNELVRKAAQGKKFLEYETGSGWGPLCEFLGLPVLDAPYPRSDDWVAYKKDVGERERLRKEQEEKATAAA
ncbi:putative NAD dependent epimerase/dehydratase [Seiridium cardinale]|uniref:NAD dependent epimerase/dehydratase n=1 Tax=Seiridium cardinale TaxID=138064 RepID=A0ABR2XZW3_9PEZI